MLLQLVSMCMHGPSRRLRLIRSQERSGRRDSGICPQRWQLGYFGLTPPKAVYESGVTGFHLVRKLRELGVDCIVGAVSKMQRPASDKRKKNDRNDAEFLARQLLAHNVVEVFVPDEETEAARSLSRVLEDIRDDLTRAKHRLTHLLIRWGYVWNEYTPEGKRKGTWTRARWEWIRSVELPESAAQESLDYYISEVRHIEAQKKAMEKRIAQYAQRPRWCERVEALRCMKGIETMTAFALTVEAGVFSRFDSARAFASWLGLVPSEHSSGEHVSRGAIAKAGNSHLRKLLVEASWHYARAAKERKRAFSDPSVPFAISNHAASGIKRLVKRRRRLACDLHKRPVVANVATARELACWCWALGRMSEGTLS